MRKAKAIKRPAATEASRLLVDYVLHDSTTIKSSVIDPVIDHLRHDYLWDYFDKEDALKRFLGVALFAAKYYYAEKICGSYRYYNNSEYTKMFRLNDRRAAAADLLDYYMDDIADCY